MPPSLICLQSLMRSEPPQTTAQMVLCIAPAGAAPTDWNGSSAFTRVVSYATCPTVQGGHESVSHTAASMLFLESDNTERNVLWLKLFSNFPLASESSIIS